MNYPMSTTPKNSEHLIRHLMVEIGVPENEQDDLLQELQLKFHRPKSIRKLSAVKNLTGYLRKAIQRKQIDVARKQKADRKALDRYKDSLMGRPISSDFYLETDGNVPTSNPIRNEEILRVREAIQSLPKNDQEAITLFYIEELSTKDIAKKLKSTPSAIQQRLARARTKLTKKLAEVG